MSVRCAPSPLRTTTAGGARSMPTIHILSTLWISCPHSINILSTFYPHSVHILSTFLIARAVWDALGGLARVSRDKGRDGSSLSCSCCQFVSCWWEARGLMSVVLVVVGDCGVVPAPSMASGWWCWLVRVRVDRGLWVVVVACGGALLWCCCLCAPADHGLEKMFAKCVALWISTLYLC